MRDGVIGMELIGRMTGNLQAPVIEDVLALLDHDSGADLSLQGRAELDFSESGGGLAAFEASTLLFLPNQALLEAALETPIPALGPMHVTADLAWAGDWISLRSAELDLEALARLQVGAEGRIGQFSAKHFAFELDPQIDISATALDNRPLVFLFEALTDDTGSTSDG